MAASDTIIQLRGLLAERFPCPPEKPASCLPTGVPLLDARLQGGLEKGAITELITPGAGSASLIVSLLRAAAAVNRHVAFIDGLDCFDPQPVGNALLARLLWVRCRNAAEAVRAADLLLRDGNLPLVLLDLCLNPAAQLRKIPLANWYRLQRVIERTSTALLAFTPASLIGSAQAKLLLRSHFTLAALEMEESQLWEQLELHDAWAGRGRCAL